MIDWSFTCTLPDGMALTILPAGIRLTRDGEEHQHTFDDLMNGQTRQVSIGWMDAGLAERVKATKTVFPLLDAEVRAGRLAGTYDELAAIAGGRVPLRGFGESKRAVLARVLESSPTAPPTVITGRI